MVAVPLSYLWVQVYGVIDVFALGFIVLAFHLFNVHGLPPVFPRDSKNNLLTLQK